MNRYLMDHIEVRNYWFLAALFILLRDIAQPHGPHIGAFTLGDACNLAALALLVWGSTLAAMASWRRSHSS